MFVYSRHPIDFWSGWLSEEEFKKQLSETYSSDKDRADAWAEYEEFRDKAFKLATKIGWEGDVRGSVYVAGLPSADDEGQVMIGWKQDNNGETFVASPYELPWMNQGSLERTSG